MIPRLFVTAALGPDQRVALDSDRTHYIRNVMRRNIGDEVGLFNGRDGEWLGRIDTYGKGTTGIALTTQRRPQSASPDVWLAFAPIKRQRIDFIAEKATELGVAALWPVFTQHTIVGRVNRDRLVATAIEAAEQ